MKPPISLREIFNDFPLSYSPASVPELPICGIAIDSRKVERGDLFVARRGGAVDGHDFIPAALEHGAAAVVGERELHDLPVPYVRVEDSIQAVTWLAAAFHGWPGRKLTVVGVTGTDGKTTTCNLLYQIMLSAGIKAGMISTVNAIIGDEVLDTGFHVTTPDAQDVQRYLARMVAAGLTHVILETTSHGLAQHRVDASQYDAAVVTNITHEHLDQHGSYENYCAAKARLIRLLESTASKPQGNPRLAVLNREDASYPYLTTIARELQSVNCTSYGLDSRADIHASHLVCGVDGIHFEALGENLQVAIHSPLLGEFNASNCLAALAVAVRGLGVEAEAAARGISAVREVTGRMERIDLGQPFTAMVDFAHTPNALRVAIMAARKYLEDVPEPGGSKTHAPGKKRIIAVFGSAGLRDKEKRRLMAETSADLADVSLLTAEDPRTESLAGILDEMAGGAAGRGGVEGETFHRIPDRGEAIRFAVRMAAPGDIVIVCGKGHEQSMCFGEIEYPWDDRTALRSALAELLNIPGPAMPYLPTQD